MEVLKSILALLTAAGLGSLPALLITAITSYLNRRTAADQLEAEKLRRKP